QAVHLTKVPPCLSRISAEITCASRVAQSKIARHRKLTVPHTAAPARVLARRRAARTPSYTPWQEILLLDPPDFLSRLPHQRLGRDFGVFASTSAALFAALPACIALSWRISAI